MTKPADWCSALEAEYHALHGSPAIEGDGASDRDERLAAVHAQIHKHSTTALCLSGGGIRSATFSLGVLQGLATVGILGKLDYLSTVSGGGYIGGWFTAWLHRAGTAGRDRVLATIDPTSRLDDAPGPKASVDGGDQGSPVERVRRTCRYLAPRGGLVSADVWTLVATMARNLVRNWLVLLPLIAAALTLPRVYYGAVQAIERGFTPYTAAAWDAASVSFAIMIACFAIATSYLVINLVGVGGRWSQGRFLGWFLLPAIFGSMAATFFWAASPTAPNLKNSLLLAALIPAGGWIVVGAVAAFFRRRHAADGGTLRVRVGVRTVLAALAAGPIIGAGAWWFGSFEYGFGASEPLRQLYAVFAVPLVLLLVLLQMVVFVGLASSELDDAVLEWWSRCGAWLGIAAAVWISAGVLVFYMADLVEDGIGAVSAALSMNHRTASAIVAAIMPLVSSLVGLAARAGGAPGRPSTVRVILQRLGLPAIVFALLSTIAWADLRASEQLEYHRVGAELCTPLMIEVCHSAGAGLGENVMLFAGLLAFGLVMSWFVPVNRFSLHGMYRQRLIRTFLGASRRDRRPNGFTGFDAFDDLRIHELAGVRPLHVVNATLNAVSSTHVGRHEIEAESFTFTPLFVGNQEVGYRRADEYGSDGGGSATGLSFGTTLAVSGAAASPAMGIFSTKSRAFLLTLANARLGLWFGNPSDDTAWKRSEPPLGVGPAVRELLGLTTDRNPYVYLSDGGHYENLGVWEMVARRCRFVIVSDGGCDPNYTFDDLANAVRRIRLDLGIPIQFPPLDITRAGQGTTNRHVAIGRIRYAVVDGPDAPDGTILYLKATLSGDEPVDVKNFALSDPTFPHDSTGNQFFDEARFESYRTLGYHTVLTVADGLRHLPHVEALCDAARKSLADLDARATAAPPAAPV